MAVQTQIQVRRGTAATWTSTNPTLAAGEWGLETDTGKYKIGTGSAVWTSLGYASILPSTVTTKGDLLAASGNATVTRQAVGSDGYQLVADSSQTTGLGWAGNVAAGKNAVINGGFDIWQRGTTFSTNGAYCADRWVAYADAGTFSVTRSTDAPTGFNYSLSYAGTSTTSPQIYTLIESANAASFAGQTVTLSIYAKSTVGSSALSYATYYPNATDNFTTVTNDTVGTFTASPAGTWTRYTATFTVNALASRGYKVLIYRASSAASSTTLYAGIQIELGSNASTFARAGGTIQGELAACQRYYFRNTTGQNFGNVASGLASSTTEGIFIVNLPVQMRVSPTSVEWSGLRVTDMIGISSVPGTLAITTGECSPNTGRVQTTGNSGLTQYRPYYLSANSSTTAYIGFNAEL